MDIKAKLGYVERDIRNIARADDTDSAVRDAALDKVIEIAETERAAMRDRLAEKTAELQ